jgi:type 1 glutamine amidotransferase
MRLPRRALLFGSAALPALARAQRKLSALIIDGVNNHDWQTGTAAIRTILERSGRFTVELSTTPAAAAGPAAWDAWRPDFTKHDVVISNFNGGHLPNGRRWPTAVEDALDTYVRRGGGFVSFHAANNAFLEWPAYNEMIGLGWRDPSFGPGLILDDREQVVIVPAGEGPRPGHGPRHDFIMTMLDPRHPITAGFPKRWLHPAEQLTHGQHAPANTGHGSIDRELRILTCAWSKDSLRREPLDWIRSWGRGRIYVTMLGHTWRNEDNPNLRCAGFQTLLARGVEWAASGKVTLPLPQNLPTADSAVLTGLPLAQ